MSDEILNKIKERLFSKVEPLLLITILVAVAWWTEYREKGDKK